MNDAAINFLLVIGIIAGYLALANLAGRIIQYGTRFDSDGDD